MSPPSRDQPATIPEPISPTTRGARSVPQTFLPPYLLERLAPREDTSDASGDTLRLDAELRNRRQQPSRSLLAPSAAADKGRRLIHTAHNTETLPGDVVRREQD